MKLLKCFHLTREHSQLLAVGRYKQIEGCNLTLYAVAAI